MLALALLVLPLALDTFAVAAALGLAGLTGRDRLRVSLLFTAFEGLMPLVGLLAGRAAGGLLAGLAEWAAAALLIALGLYLLLSRDEEPAGEELLARSRGLAMLGLGLSISLDELAIGFTAGLLRLPLLLAVVLIAGQAFIVTQAGVAIGARAGERVREGAERLAGAVLLVLGIAVAGAHLLGLSL